MRIMQMTLTPKRGRSDDRVPTTTSPRRIPDDAASSPAVRRARHEDGSPDRGRGRGHAVGRGLLVSLASLLAWEQMKVLERQTATRGGEVTRTAPTRSRDVGLAPLPSGQWWQTEGDDAPAA